MPDPMHDCVGKREEAVQDDADGDEDEETGRERVPGRPQRPGRRGLTPPQDEERTGREAEEQPVGEDRVGQQLVVRVRGEQHQRHAGLEPEREDRRLVARVQASGAREEQAVAGHRVIEPRARDDHDAQEPEARDHDEQRHEPRAGVAGHAPGDIGGQRGRGRDLRRRERPEIREVQRQVQGDHDDHADHVGACQVPRRILDFGSQRSATLPAAVREEDRHERGEEETRARTPPAPATSAQIQVARRAGAVGEDERQQHQDSAHLRRHERVVGALARAHAGDVHDRERHQREGGHRAHPHGAERHERSVDVGGKEDGDRGERSAVDDEEQRHAVEEADDRRVRAREVDVLPADVRQPRAQLGPDEPAQQGDAAAHRPCQQDQQRCVQHPRHV